MCSPLTLRAGIATGYALLFEGDDYIGSAVNMASRLCDTAEPHQVLIPTMGVERLPEGDHRRPDRRRSRSPASPARSRCSSSPAGPPQADNTDTGELWTRSPFI